MKPRLERSLLTVFRRIGVPEPEPFRPDPFQVEALQRLEVGDVLVSAPTGAGKTWIAARAIQSCLDRGLNVWYASPLKALSNSIYQEFCREFGSSLCGILTGDRKENPDAPVVVGTTEILRNQLYDAMHAGEDIRADLVVLDEAHYLSDPDRGVVWEEVLIYLPSRVRLLLLSATISNPEEVCAWLEGIRGSPMRVVRSEERPVPLEMLFLHPGGLMGPLAGKRGLAPQVKRWAASQAKGGERRRERLRYGEIIRMLRELDLLPAIFFLKSRADCDQALRTCYGVEKPAEFRARFASELRSFLRDYPHLATHRQIWSLSDSLVGSHHGGQLPYWKVLVERMMNGGYLEAIFSTSTVAAGVNFPARTVVLVQSDRFNGREFVDLSATDLHQMIGRAGRRGMDRIGFALVLPGPHQDPALIQRLKDSPPERLRSRIQINFSMTLNLLLSHTPSEVKELLERSFAVFQEGGEHHSWTLEWERSLARLKRLLPEGRCDAEDPFEVMDHIQRRSRPGRENAGEEGRGQRRRVKQTETDVAPLPCAHCVHDGICHGSKKKELGEVLGRFRDLARAMPLFGGGLWLNFKRHVRFLRETGFADPEDRLTSDGIWASKLRLDQPLLIAEAIRRGALNGLSPTLLAAALAPFVWDRVSDQERRLRPGLDLAGLEAIFRRVLSRIEGIRVLKRRRGFDTPPITFWPAAALYLWATGTSWEQLLSVVPGDEGDMASLIMRTADHLRQVTNLMETHPELARTAAQAIDLILREPVYLP